MQHSRSLHYTREIFLIGDLKNNVLGTGKVSPTQISDTMGLEDDGLQIKVLYRVIRPLPKFQLDVLTSTSHLH